MGHGHCTTYINHAPSFLFKEYIYIYISHDTRRVSTWLIPAGYECKERQWGLWMVNGQETVFCWVPVP
jgi:hypothetical protein